MKTYNAKDIRNIAIAGHGGRGKTTLAEAMLYLAKVNDRLGKAAERSTTATLSAIEWNNTKINVLDAPGLFDFAGGLSEAARAAETIITVLTSGGDIDVGAEKAVKAANDRGIAKFFVVTSNDTEKADFGKTLDSIKAEYGAPVCPVVVPVSGGFADLASGKAYSYSNGKATEIAFPADEVADYQAAFTEAVASADEELMEKFFMEEPLTPDEIAKGLKAGVASGDIFPVFACTGLTADAVDLLLNGIVLCAPDATYAAEGDFKVDENGPIAAYCFKTVDDRFGKMSFFKVISGKLSADVPAYNSRTTDSERIGKMVFLSGDKQEDATVIPAGDIGIVTKLDGFKTGDTLCVAKGDVELAKTNYPNPCLSQAVRAKKKGEDDKVAAGLNRICSEDPTVKFETNVETHEQVLSCLGEQHLAFIINKLKTRFNVEVDLRTPKVAYRETIGAVYDAHGRHKKQSGGSGQFGDVWVRFEPMEGDGFEFLDEVVGGAVPRNFIPSVEKGLRLAIEKGPLTGSKVVGIRAALHDGQSHPVDSNDMAFQTAARLAFKEAMLNAKPKLLEPYAILKAYMPGDNLGDIMGDVTKRRGRVLGMGPCEDNPKMQELTAEVPMAEMGDFATVLRSVTIGRGYFDITFDHYEAAPNEVAQKVIEEAKKAAEEED